MIKTLGHKLGAGFAIALSLASLSAQADTVGGKPTFPPTRPIWIEPIRDPALDAPELPEKPLQDTRKDHEACLEQVGDPVYCMAVYCPADQQVIWRLTPGHQIPDWALDERECLDQGGIITCYTCKGHVA